MKKLLFILLVPLSYINGRGTTISAKPPVIQNSILSNTNYKEEIEYYRVEINHAVDLLKTKKNLFI